MDPVTAGVGKAVASAADAASLEASKVAGNLLTRLLGPVTDEVGLALAEKYRTTNVKRVAAKAAKKVRLDKEGSIPPRVAAHVLDAAQWAENDFVAEYLSGVLASARTPGGTNDSGVSWSALVARLSSDYLKLHLAVYSAARKLAEGMQIDRIDEILSRWIWVTVDDISKFVDLESNSSFLDSIYTLKAEGLLGKMAHGKGATLGALLRPPRRIEGHGLMLQLSVRGIAFYFQVFGLGGRWVKDIALPEVGAAIELPDGLGPIPSAVWMEQLPLMED